MLNLSIFAQTLVVGGAAGIASALMFAVILTGTPLSLFLLFVSPLPVLIAGLGWSHYAALLAIGIAGFILSLTTTDTFIYSYLIMVAAPAWLLTFFTLWNRETTTGSSVWLAPGILLLGCACLASVTVLISALRIGSFDDYSAFVRELVETVMKFQLQLDPAQPLTLPAEGNGIDVIGLLMSSIPVFLGLMMTFYCAVNLWGAARIVAMSHMLLRPWRHLHTVFIPTSALAAFILAAVMMGLDGFAGLFAKTVVGSLMAVFCIQGAISLHIISRGITARPALLGVFYLTLVMMPWVLLFVALHGFITIFLDGRRYGRRPPPPSPPMEIS